MKHSVLAIVAVIPIMGCATVTRGVNDTVTVNATPPDATVTTSLGHQCSQSPCTFTVPRKQSFSVTAKKPGYKDATVQVLTKVAGGGGAGMAGNVLLGGFIGAGVDAVSGAMLSHSPNPVNISLVSTSE